LYNESSTWYFDFFKVTVQSGTELRIDTNKSDFAIQNLTAGLQYTISIYTVMRFQEKNVECASPQQFVSFTGKF